MLVNILEIYTPEYLLYQYHNQHQQKLHYLINYNQISFSLKQGLNLLLIFSKVPASFYF